MVIQFVWTMLLDPSRMKMGGRKRLEGVEREAESACWGSERVGTLTRHRLQGDSVRVSPAPSCSFELYIRPATPPEPAYLPLVGTVSIAMGMEAQPARAWEDTAQPAQGPGPPPCTLRLFIWNATPLCRTTPHPIP